METKQNNILEVDVASLIKNLTSADEDEHEFIVKSMLEECPITSDTYVVKSWSSKQEMWNERGTPNYSVERVLLKAKRFNCTEIDAALLKKKLILAVKEGNKDIVKCAFEKIFNVSHIFMKLCYSDSSTKECDYKFEIWRDAMYATNENYTEHSEEIMKHLLDFDIINTLETKMDTLLLHRLTRHESNFDQKDLRLFEMLLKSEQINVNARDEDGSTALHLAEDDNIITLLIRYGADVNKKDNEGKTPLMSKVNRGASVLPIILKEAGTLVDLDAIDCNGQTALMIATIDNRADVVELLLNAGASVNLSDHRGFTALHHALFPGFDHYDHFPRNFEELKKRKEIFTILFDAKDERRDCYMRDKGWNAKRIGIVEMLLQRPNLDVNALSFEKFSPLDLVEGWIPQLPQSIKTVLKEKGAILNVFQQTESQSTSDFYLDVRCMLDLQRLVNNLHAQSDKDLRVDLFKKRLLSLIEAFQGQIRSSKDQRGRTALHLVAIFLFRTWGVGSRGGFIIDDDQCHKKNFNWNYSSRARNDAEIYLEDLANTILNELIKIDCNVNETDIFGRTPLHYADKILKDLLLSHEADASIRDKYGNSAIDEIPPQSSTESSDIVMEVIDRYDETYFLRLVNNKQMDIDVHCADSKVRAFNDRESWLQTVPRLLWEKGEYACRHLLVDQINEEMKDLMSTIAKEIERLDPRFAIRPEFVGSSNEGTRLNEPDEFDFCFVLAKISELCEVSRSPELPTGFVHLKRKPLKVQETSDFDSLYDRDGLLSTEKLNWQFTTILRNALVNIENQQGLDYNFILPTQYSFDSLKKVSNIKIRKPLRSNSVFCISIDIVPCIHVDDWWPDEAISNVSDEIKTFGCKLIFDRPHKLYPWVPYSESCARISFAKAESFMIKQSCDNAKKALMIGKTMIENSPLNHGYILKNCLLYCIEALKPTSEKASQLGLSLEEMKSKFHQMDRYLWLKCLLKCHLEFVAQDFCPCYFLPNFMSPIEESHLKKSSSYWMMRNYVSFPRLCRNAYAFYRCTSNAMSDSCCQFPPPDLLWERFDRNLLIASLCEIAYK